MNDVSLKRAKRSRRCRLQCRVTLFQVLESWLPAGSSKPSIPLGSENRYKTYLGRMKHWLLHRLSTASHHIGQIRTQVTSTTSRWSRMGGALQNGLIDAVFYPLCVRRWVKLLFCWLIYIIFAFIASPTWYSLFTCLLLHHCFSLNKRHGLSVDSGISAAKFLNNVIES